LIQVNSAAGNSDIRIIAECSRHIVGIKMTIEELKILVMMVLFGILFAAIYVTKKSHSQPWSGNE